MHRQLFFLVLEVSCAQPRARITVLLQLQRAFGSRIDSMEYPAAIEWILSITVLVRHAAASLMARQDCVIQP